MKYAEQYEIEYRDLISAGSDLRLYLLDYQVSIDSRFAEYSPTLSTLLYNRVSHSVACVSSSNVLQRTNADVEEFFRHLSAVLNMTMTKYISLIAAIEDQKTKLLAPVKIKHTGRTWRNDTPQSDNLNAESEDLTHLSDFTKDGTEDENPMATPVARLAEIETSLSNAWQSWTDEIIRQLHLED